jgi:hypothetical protein
MRLGHALLSVFVGKDRGSCGVKTRVVIGMVEVPVSVDDVFQRSVAKAIESRFEPWPSWSNESVYDEFAVGTVEGYHGSAGAVELSDIISELLRFDRNCVELGTHTREQVGRRRWLLRVARGGGVEQRRGKEVRQKGACCQRGRISQHLAARRLLL